MAREQHGAEAGYPSGRRTLARWICITGLPAGFAYLVQGLLGYLNPSTYLGTSLGNTLLRTYAEGSLPGSDIARLLGLGQSGAS